MRCAECNCENGDEDCNWIKSPVVTDEEWAKARPYRELFDLKTHKRLDNKEGQK